MNLNILLTPSSPANVGIVLHHLNTFFSSLMATIPYLKCHMNLLIGILKYDMSR